MRFGLPIPVATPIPTFIPPPRTVALRPQPPQPGAAPGGRPSTQVSLPAAVLHSPAGAGTTSGVTPEIGKLEEKRTLPALPDPGGPGGPGGVPTPPPPSSASIKPAPPPPHPAVPQPAFVKPPSPPPHPPAPSPALVKPSPPTPPPAHVIEAQPAISDHFRQRRRVCAVGPLLIWCDRPGRSIHCDRNAGLGIDKHETARQGLVAARE
jgi:hypothetical protein